MWKLTGLFCLVLLFLPVGFCFNFFGLLSPQTVLVVPADVNGEDLNVGTIVAGVVDANAVFANFFVARNYIDANFLLNANVNGDLNVSGRFNSADLNANFVPYVGATKDVNLGNHDLNARAGKFGTASVSGTPSYGINFGYGNTTGANSMSMGTYAYSEGEGTALGYQAGAYGYGASAFGATATTGGEYAVALGYGATTYAGYSIAIGNLAQAGGEGSTTLGYLATAANADEIVLGTTDGAYGPKTQLDIYAGTANFQDNNIATTGAGVVSELYQTAASSGSLRIWSDVTDPWSGLYPTVESANGYEIFKGGFLGFETATVPSMVQVTDNTGGFANRFLADTPLVQSIYGAGLGFTGDYSTVIWSDAGIYNFFGAVKDDGAIHAGTGTFGAIATTGTGVFGKVFSTGDVNAKQNLRVGGDANVANDLNVMSSLAVGKGIWMQKGLYDGDMNVDQNIYAKKVWLSDGANWLKMNVSAGGAPAISGKYGAAGSRIDFTDYSGFSAWTLNMDLGVYDDISLITNRKQNSSFVFASPAGAYGTEKTFTVRGMGTGNGNAIGLWNEYPDDYFDINTTSLLRKNVKMMGNAVIGDSTSLGAEKITNGTFTGSSASWTLGTGWTYNSNLIRKDVAGTGTLSQTSAAMVTPLVVGETYQLKFTVSTITYYNDSAVIPSIAGVTLSPTAGSKIHEYYFTAASTADLVFTPVDASTRFYLDDVSLKKITDGNLTVLGSGSFASDLNVGRDINAARNLSVIGSVALGGGSAGKAMCWKADGKTLGYCSTIIDAFGACTCN